jgi:hypothetical protein
VQQADSPVAQVVRGEHRHARLHARFRDRGTQRVGATAGEQRRRRVLRAAAQRRLQRVRRTFASLRCAAGDDVAYVSDQLGHVDPRFTLRVYAKATRRRERLAGAHLAAFDRAIEWAGMGSNGVPELSAVPVAATGNGF